MALQLPPVVATFLANITDLKTKLGDAESSISKTATLSEAKMAEVEASVDKQVAEMSVAAKAAGTEFDATATKAELMATKTEEASTRSSGAFTKMAAVGKVALLGIVAGAAIVGVTAVKSAEQYQTLTTQLVTGAGESESAIGQVSAGLLKMAPAVATGPDALAKSMFTVESAGYHGADGLKVMQAAAEGAKIGGADATVVANGLTTAMTDYHIGADQAAATTSKLVETVASGKTTMADLSGSLSNVLPTAAAAKVGLDQVLGAMATMTGEGISADQASQDLANTIRGLQAPTQVQTKAMEALGLNSLDVANSLGQKGLTGTLGDLVTAITQHMGPAGDVIRDTFKKSETAAADANTELAAMPASLQSIAKQFQAGQLTSAQWRADMKGMSTENKQLAQQFAATVQGGQGFNDLLKAGGPSAETFSAALSGVTGGATGMNTALALTGGNMGTFQANVKNISGASTEAGGHVQGWATTTKDLSFQLEQAKAFVEALWINIGLKLIPYVSSAIKIGIEWGQWLGKHKLVLEAVGIVIGTVLVAAITAYAVSAAVAAYNTLLMLAPFIAIVAAVALVAVGVYELYEHWSTIWGEIKHIASEAANFVIGVFNDVWHFLQKWGPLILAAILPFIGLPLLIWQHWSVIAGFFQKIWGDVEAVFSTVLGWLYDWFIGLPLKALAWLGDLGGLLVGKGEALLQGLVNGGLAVWNGYISFWTGMGGTVLSWLQGAAGWLYGIGGDIINGLIRGIENGFGQIESTIKGLGSKIVGWAKDALSIFSPSQVMADAVGQYIPAGIAMGVTGNTGILQNATKQVAQAAIDGGQSAMINRSPGPAPSTGEGSASGMTIHIHVDGTVLGDPQKIFTAVQQAFLEHGAVNSQTYQEFNRGAPR